MIGVCVCQFDFLVLLLLVILSKPREARPLVVTHKAEPRETRNSQQPQNSSHTSATTTSQKNAFRCGGM